MSTLLLRLSGPMQSWGTQSRYSERDTGHEPSKSGVIGLLCAALGKPREEGLDDRPQLKELASLMMGVRVDRPGTVLMDFQTAGGVHRPDDPFGAYGVVRADGQPGRRRWSDGQGTVLSRRYYLSDADFLVGLEGDDGLLRALFAALQGPIFQIFLGRKAFVPSVPVHLPDAGPDSSYWHLPLLEALRSYAWPRTRDGTPVPQLEITADADEPALGTALRQDVPIDFASRRFALRPVRTEFVTPADRSRER